MHILIEIITNFFTFAKCMYLELHGSCSHFNITELEGNLGVQQDIREISHLIG